ncbi:MAG TPA: hypothetical protein VGF45_08460, partial [Polyangia bacterium]
SFDELLNRHRFGAEPLVERDDLLEALRGQVLRLLDVLGECAEVLVQGLGELFAGELRGYEANTTAVETLKQMAGRALEIIK